MEGYLDYVPSMLAAASSEQAKITSTRNGVLSGGHVELSENALDMRFDGVERDVELVADLSLREVGPEQPYTRRALDH